DQSGGAGIVTAVIPSGSERPGGAGGAPISRLCRTHPPGPLAHARGDRRCAGVLLHPTSLPGPYGAGDMGEELVAFLDWVASAGMHVWQVLPLNPPGYGFSPYGCLSSYAGNPLLISPQRLREANLLPDFDAPQLDDERVDFDRVIEFKSRLL